MQSTQKWNVPIAFLHEEDAFPFPEPSSPATLPAALVAPNKPIITISHWGEEPKKTNRDAVKFWAGSGGYPGSALMRDALELIRDSLDTAVDDPFSLSAPQSSSFRFDWRRDYIPIDVGFSPNDHAALVMLGFPLVEILAAIGLENARPKKINKLEYRYGVIAASSTDFCSLAFLRASLSGTKLPFPQRIFRMYLGWPGQENQARCITDVIEENYP
jgi:CRISPR-associated protein Csx14